MTRVQITADREGIDATFSMAFGHVAHKKLADALASLRDKLGALTVTLAARVDRDLDYSCTLRDGREWVQRLHLDGRVDFGGVRGSWTKVELETLMASAGCLLSLVREQGLESLAATWTDPGAEPAEDAEPEVRG